MFYFPVAVETMDAFPHQTSWEKIFYLRALSLYVGNVFYFSILHQRNSGKRGKF